MTGSLAETGCLPAEVDAGGTILSLGQAFVGFARLLLRPDAPSVEVPAVAPYPTLADELAAQVRQRIRGWMIHPPELDLSRIEEATRLQTWTLKPAWERDRLPWEPHRAHGQNH